MIRRSTAIGVGALILSLIIHVVGLSLTGADVASPETADQGVERVEVGDDFADLAETSITPVEPTPAEPPEPPEETPPEPTEAEAPTSEALVASSNPQATFAPDSGPADAVQPTVNEPVSPETTDGQEGGASSDAPQTTAPAPAPTPPVETETQEVAEGSPDADPSALPPVAAPFAPPAVTEPVVTPPTAPLAAAPLPDVIAALPPEAQPPEVPPANVEVQNQPPESETSEAGTTTSLRPQLRPTPPSSQRFGAVDGSAGQSSPPPPAPPTNLIESPLTAFKRDGTNLFAGRRARSQSSGSRSGGSLGPGNSNVTNYAGRVLMQLNRVPPVAVSVRGWARVLFRINPDGTLATVDIIDGSGSSEVERAAREHVRRGAPFPPPPGGQSRALNFVYRVQQ
ncbi:energy transducer TonB [uncultured Tateyamaria sp.]|uniref:energy transducer TonB n=1 Tax=uncultured Tateyamaria sp. TaxID=455651 RepID=UPI002617D28A|nr:energy transducer TonB [uncultured Tateyamaria sp.]